MSTRHFMIEQEKYIQFENQEEIIHMFSKRPFNFNRKTVDEEIIKEEFNEVEKLLDYKFKDIKRPIQKHTNVVKVITKDNYDEPLDGVDGLITNIKGIALVTVLADCQGILLYDPVKKVIGNIHSGWKGTLNKIIITAINLMKKEFNCNTKDVKVYFSPSILKCCFEVDIDVVDMFKNNFDNIDEFIFEGKVKDNKQKYYIDTIGINKNEMQKLEIKKENIFEFNICTMCNSNKYHSYRVDHEKSGRNIALICLK